MSIVDVGARIEVAKTVAGDERLDGPLKVHELEEREYFAVRLAHAQRADRSDEAIDTSAVQLDDAVLLRHAPDVDVALQLPVPLRQLQFASALALVLAFVELVATIVHVVHVVLEAHHQDHVFPHDHAGYRTVVVDHHDVQRLAAYLPRVFLFACLASDRYVLCREPALVPVLALRLAVAVAVAVAVDLVVHLVELAVDLAIHQVDDLAAELGSDSEHDSVIVSVPEAVLVVVIASVLVLALVPVFLSVLVLVLVTAISIVLVLVFVFVMAMVIEAVFAFEVEFAFGFAFRSEFEIAFQFLLEIVLDLLLEIALDLAHQLGQH